MKTGGKPYQIIKNTTKAVEKIQTSPEICRNETAGRFETSEKVIKFLVKSAFYKKLKVIRFSKHEKPPKWYNGC